MKRVRTQRRPAGGAPPGGGARSAAPAATGRERASESGSAGQVADISGRDPQGLFALQRLIGNQAIGNMLREPPSSVEQGAPAQTSVSQATVAPASFARKPDAPTSSPTQHVSPQQTAPGDPQSGLLLRLAASGQNHAVQSLARRSEPRGPEGKRNPVRETATASQPPIQRMVMSYQAWKAKSTGVAARRRSAELLKVDQALIEYNAAQREAPAVRVGLLDTLETAISTWMNSKDVRTHVEGPRTGRFRMHTEVRQGHEPRRIKNWRVDAVRALRKRVRREQTALADLDVGNVTSSSGVLTVAMDINRRAVRWAQNALAKPGPLTTLDKKVAAEFKNLESEGASLKAQSSGLKGANVPADALVEALRGYGQILDGKKPGASLGKLTTTPGTGPAAFVETVKADLLRLHSVAAAKKPGSKGSLLEGDAAEAASQSLGITESGMDIGGYREGTKGKGNEGFEEAFKNKPADGEDERNEATKWVADKLGAKEGNDVKSATFDIGSTLAGGAGEVLSVFQARKTLNDPDASAADKRAAELTLYQAPGKALAAAGKFAGGAATAHEGRGKSGLFSGTAPDEHGVVKPTANISTDLKFIGDVGGILSGFLGIVGKLFDLIKHDSDMSEKQKQNVGSNQDIGLRFKKVWDLLTAAMNSTKSVMKLGYQIAGGGQVVMSNVSEGAKAFMGMGVPFVNMIKATIDSAQYGHNVWRFRARGIDLGKKIKELLKKPGTDLAMIEAVEFARGTLKKRMDRAGINLGHALASVVAAGFNTSGIGLAPGMIIGLSSGALKLGQFGVRTAKQKKRNAAAKARAKANKGDETWEAYKVRKRVKAAEKGLGARASTAAKLTFMFNWDKSGKKKKQSATAVALELLRMNDDDIFKSLGVTAALGKESDAAKRLNIVVGALKKRG